MTLQELDRRLRKSRDAGVYTLRGEALESPALARLLSRTCDGVLKVVTGADPIRDGERLAVAGAVHGSVLGLSGVTARAEFFLWDGEVHAVIAFRGAGGAHALGELFPSLADQAAGAFAFEAPVLRLCTLPGAAAERLERLRAWQEERALNWDDDVDGAKVVRHVEVEGALGLPEGWAWLGDLLPAPTDAVLGTVELHGRAPRGWFSVSWPNAIGVGHLTASFTLDVVTLLDVLDEDGVRTAEPRSLFRLGAHLAYDGVRIPTYAWFTEDDPRELRFETITGPAVRAGIDAFKGLLGGVTPTDLIPADGFPAVDQVVLQRVCWGLLLDEGRPDFVEAEFGLDPESRLTLIPGVLEADALSVSLAVYGLAGDGPSPALYASGRFSVPDSPLHGAIEGEVSLPDLGFRVGLARGSVVDLTDLLKRILPIELGLPELVCTGLSMDGSARDGRTSFHVELDTPDGLELLGVRLEDVWVAFTYQGGEVAEGSLQVGGTLAVGEDAGIDLMAEYYNRDGVQGLHFRGSYEADPESPLRLEEVLPEAIRPDADLFPFAIRRVAVDIDTGRGRLGFELETAEARVDFGSVGNATLRGVTVEVGRGEEGYDWKVAARGRIELAELERENGWVVPLVALDGELVQAGGREAGVWFESAHEDSGLHDVWLPIPAGHGDHGGALSWASFDLSLKRIGLRRAAAESGVEGGSGWRFDADGTLVFRGLPTFLDMFMPERGLHAVLTIDARGAEITLKDSVLDVRIPNVHLPDPMGGAGVDLGPSRLYVGDLALVLRRRFEVDAEVRYYLPRDLNAVFGRTDSGEPRLGHLFATFDPEDPDGSRYLGLTFKGGYTAKSGPTVGVTPVALPIDFLEEEGDWWVLNLGAKEADGMGRYGCIRFQKGDFVLEPSRNRFKVSGAVEIAKDPALPLDLLKAFLRHAGVGVLEYVFPDRVRIPLREPPDFWDADGELDPTKIAAHLGLDLRRHPDIAEALDQVAAYYNRLPEDFRAYLEPPSLKSLAWSFELRMDGAMEVSLEVDPPVRMLMLGSLATPVVTGLTLRKLSFGPMFGGQVFKLRLDADLDMFDILTLGAAVLVPDAWHPYFGDPQKFRRRIVLHDLLVLIFMQAEIPIPVPIFFDPLGVHFYVPGNATLHLEAAFPEPEFDLEKAGELARDLVRFVREEGVRLDVDKSLSPFDLQLTLGPAYVQAGKQGEEITLGRTDPLPLPSAYQLMARILNAVKFLNVDDMVRAVPVEYRFLEVEAARVLPFLEVGGTWLLCTPTEFRDGLYERMGIDKRRAHLLLDLLPSQPDGRRSDVGTGVVSFVEGRTTLASASLAAAVAFVGVSGKELGMAVRLQGRVAGFLDLDARAALLIAPPKIPFRLTGAQSTRLDVLGMKVFEGETETEASMDHFAVRGNFELLSAGSIVWVGTPKPISGRMTKTSLAVSGAVRAKVLIFTASGEITLNEHEVGWQLSFPGGKAGFRMSVDRGVVAVDGDVPLGWVRLHSESRIDPSRGTVHQTLTSSTVLDLMRHEFEFDSRVDASTTIKGEYRLMLLPSLNTSPIVRGGAEVSGSYVKIGGAFKLMPDWWPFNVSGSVSGTFSSSKVRLEGSAGIHIVVLDLTFGVVISQDEFTLTASDLFYDYRATIRVAHGGLVIWGRASNWLGTWSFYIDNKLPYFHWGDPPRMRLAPGAERVEAERVEATQPVIGWPVRLARFATMAAWRELHTQPGADVRVPLPDEAEIGAVFDWRIEPVEDADTPVVIHATERPETRVVTREITAHMPSRRDTMVVGNASLTVEVEPKVEDSVRMLVSVPTADGRRVRVSTTVDVTAGDDIYAKLAEAIVETRDGG